FLRHAAQGAGGGDAERRTKTLAGSTEMGLDEIVEVLPRLLSFQRHQDPRLDEIATRRQMGLEGRRRAAARRLGAGDGRHPPKIRMRWAAEGAGAAGSGSEAGAPEPMAVLKASASSSAERGNAVSFASQGRPL